MYILFLHFFPTYPERGGQTEVTSDQTIFERTHVLGALEIHGLEQNSSALLSGQWSGSCLIRGHVGLGRSDQRQFWAQTCLINGQFERTLVWSEADSCAHWSDQRTIRAEFFFQFLFVFGLLTEAVSPKSLQYRRILIRDPSRAWWVDQKQEA